MGIVEFITVILVVCKIFGLGIVAEWSWLKVLIPEIIACGFYLLMIIGYFWFIKKTWNKF